MKIQEEDEEDDGEDVCPIYGRVQIDDIPSDIELERN